MSGELARVLADVRLNRTIAFTGVDCAHCAAVRNVFYEELDRIEAAARADHPEDWPPKDGEIKDVAIREEDGGHRLMAFLVAYGGAWHYKSHRFSDPDWAALRQLAKERRL